RWCIEPMLRIVANVRRQVPGAKIIGFPRGVGSSLPRYVERIEIDAVGLDWMIDRAFARDRIQSRRPVQGNLDPLVLLAGGAALAAVRNLQGDGAPAAACDHQSGHDRDLAAGPLAGVGWPLFRRRVASRQTCPRSYALRRAWPVRPLCARLRGRSEPTFAEI